MRWGGTRKGSGTFYTRPQLAGPTVRRALDFVVSLQLPFGGVGASGMGSYHGADGFKAFSHAKAIYTQPKIDLAGLAGFKPPYGDKTRKALARELKP